MAITEAQVQGGKTELKLKEKKTVIKCISLNLNQCMFFIFLFVFTM